MNKILIWLTIIVVTVSGIGYLGANMSGTWDSGTAGLGNLIFVQDSDHAILGVRGFEAKDAAIALQADDSDDTADRWQFRATAGGSCIISNESAGTIATFSSTGIVVPINKSVTLDGTTARILTAADYGKLLTFTNAAAVAVTLPANGAPAGTTIDICQGTTGSDSIVLTISAATADTLIGPNDIDLKSVTWATGHRIGAYARFFSDGSFWHVLNLGGTTMTYTD